VRVCVCIFVYVCTLECVCLNMCTCMFLYPPQRTCPLAGLCVRACVRVCICTCVRKFPAYICATRHPSARESPTSNPRLWVTFRQRALYLVAFWREMTYNLRHPMQSQHPVAQPHLLGFPCSPFDAHSHIFIRIFNTYICIHVDLSYIEYANIGHLITYIHIFTCVSVYD